MRNILFLISITVILFSSCKKEDRVFNPELIGHWKYIGYVKDGTNDTIPPPIYHPCDSCMSLIFTEKTYYARSALKVATITGYSKGNTIRLPPWGPSEDIGEIGLDETFWVGVLYPNTWRIQNEILELKSTRHTSKLIFRRK